MSDRLTLVAEGPEEDGSWAIRVNMPDGRVLATAGETLLDAIHNAAESWPDDLATLDAGHAQTAALDVVTLRISLLAVEREAARGHDPDEVRWRADCRRAAAALRAALGDDRMSDRLTPEEAVERLDGIIQYFDKGEDDTRVKNRLPCRPLVDDLRDIRATLDAALAERGYVIRPATDEGLREALADHAVIQRLLDEHTALRLAVEASIQDLALGTSGRVHRAEQRLRAAVAADGAAGETGPWMARCREMGRNPSMAVTTCAPPPSSSD